MKELFDTTALKCSRLITRHYSTSFTLGIQTLHKRHHLPVYAIYGFVRYADEIVDTFHDHDKADLLAKFKKDTYEAIDSGISLNPVLHAFQMVVNKYNIDHDLIEAFLFSMEMDLSDIKYDKELYEKYIYGSAEVVGLMCLKVFCEGNDDEYLSLKEPATRLGSAFQKVNFIRDIKSDFDDRSRVYFPGVDFEKFDDNAKREIERDIQQDFDAALKGIRRLPSGSRLGVYLAYIYYLRLFEKIKRLPSSRILTERIRIPNPVKMLLLAQTYLRHSLKAL